MGWIIGIIYFVLLVSLGVLSLRKGHWVMFIVACLFRSSGSSAPCCRDEWPGCDPELPGAVELPALEARFALLHEGPCRLAVVLG
jgi:hypothetical protein